MTDPLTNLLQQRYYQNMHARPKRAGVHSVTDLGELAARLDSLDVYDRRGDVVWMASNTYDGLGLQERWVYLIGYCSVG